MAFSNWLNDQLAAAKKGWAKYDNRKFKEAVMAACARMAAADGTIQEEEKQGVGAIIGGIPELQAFDPSELYSLFEKYVGILTGPTGAYIGKPQCDRAIGALKGDNGAAAACVQITL